ncbi:hypothetical protein V2J09_020874 [Rumex salicifolius]
MGSCCSTRKRSFVDYVNKLQLQDLSLIPERIFVNGKSRTSCIFSQQGLKGINQDAMIAWEDFMVDDVTLCGIFDGHGPQGHLVARKVRDSLPIKLISFLSRRKEFSSGAIFSTGNKNLNHGEAGKDSSCEDKVNKLWKEAFLQAYKAMDKELNSHPDINTFCSGSTAVTIVRQGMNLYVGNIGDSRAILGSKDINGSLKAIQLTVDLKPDLPREASRIKHCKGRVFSMHDDPEVARVWLPYQDAPGLAMSRAFGDFCLKDYGVISEPEFTHRSITENDQFIVLATDGIWDVLSNKEVVKIVSSAPSRSSAAKTLVQSAAREWKLRYYMTKMDDCAAVCLFLDEKLDSDSDNPDENFSSATMQIMSGDEPHSEPCLLKSRSVGSSDESCSIQSLSGVVKSNPENPGDEDQNWSALEGVTREGIGTC